MNKRRMTLVVFAISIFGLAGLHVIASAFAAASERQEIYRYVSDALAPLPQTRHNVTWIEADAPLARDLSRSDQDRVAKRLSLAWRAVSAAQALDNPDLLNDSLSGPALERAAISVDHAHRFGSRIAVLSQSAKPVFYHADGSMLQVEVEMTVARHVIDDNALAFQQISHDKGIATLMNEATGWRLFSFENTEVNEFSGGPIGMMADRLKGVNYYPSATPWRAFWQAYDPETMNKDLGLVKALGANSIRIFLTYDDFTDPELAPQAFAALTDILAQASDRGIWVVPTLFDLKGDFAPATWETDAVFLKGVLPILEASEAVAYVDLKNEADIDFTHHGTPQITAWLSAMIGLSRDYAPALSLTIGWSAAKTAETLSGDLDLVTYHDYEPIETAAARLATVRDTVGSKPVMVTEIGMSSYDFAFGFPGTPQKQAQTLATHIKALSAADGVFVWALHDFQNIDASVFGGSPWEVRLQAQYGLYDTQGREKPAALAVRAMFQDNSN